MMYFNIQVRKKNVILRLRLNIEAVNDLDIPEIIADLTFSGGSELLYNFN